VHIGTANTGGFGTLNILRETMLDGVYAVQHGGDRPTALSSAQLSLNYEKPRSIHTTA